MFDKATNYDPELLTILKMISTSVPPHSGRVLEVGSGFGRILRPLKQMGYDVLGVEINEAIRLENTKVGLPTVSIDQFNATDDLYDLVLMSHIIEHFPPADLIGMVDSYLDRLKPGGFLLIATPLMSAHFYDDIDHIRPYPPASILTIFGNSLAQNKLRARHSLQLVDVWFRRGYPRAKYGKGILMGHSLVSKIWQALEVGMAVVFFASRGRIGKIDGWVGLLRKR